uniref:Uncharacterized protein n=1 Tax=Varanus komodoensis TaxID=61221 RepID=A0A8D2ILH5_VARKO
MFPRENLPVAPTLVLPPDQRTTKERILHRKCYFLYFISILPHSQSSLGRFQNVCWGEWSETTFLAILLQPISLSSIFLAGQLGVPWQRPTQECTALERERGKVELKAPVILGKVCDYLERLQKGGCGMVRMLQECVNSSHWEEMVVSYSDLLRTGFHIDRRSDSLWVGLGNRCPVQPLVHLFWMRFNY